MGETRRGLRGAGSGSGGTLRAALGAGPLLALLAAAYGPFVLQLHALDHDALAAVSHIRETGSFVGWVNGYYLNGLLTGAASALLDATGRVEDHYLLAYSLVVTLALGATVLLAYAMLLALTGSVALALAGATSLALSAGLLHLLSMREDNLIASCLHLQYVAVFLCCVLRPGTASSPGARRLAVALPVSLVLAVMAHHQNNVLWATPAALPWLRGEPYRGAALRRLLRTYATAAGLFLTAYVCLCWIWHGALEPGLYVRTVAQWMLPNSFYRSYYFFERLGWDLPAQAGEIAKGVSQLVYGNGPRALPVGLAVLALLGLAGWAALRERAWRDPAVRTLALFVALHVPHSLVYESANLERWDVLWPPVVVLVGLLLHRARARTLGRGRLRVPLFAAAFGALAFVLVYDLRFHAEALAHQRVTRSERRELLALLERRVAPGPAAAERRVLVLSRERFDRFAMLAGTYYAHGRDLYAVDPEGSLWWSRALYPKPVPIEREAFAARTRGARLVTDAVAAERLARDPSLAHRDSVLPSAIR